MLWLFFLVIATFAISAWDAYVAGMTWSIPYGLSKFMAWCALIMSACGFLSFWTILCGFVALEAHWIEQRGLHALLSLTYLMIIFPVLGSGLAIMLHSWLEFYKRRDFSSLGVSGWNTYAQVSNTVDAFEGIPSAFGTVIDFFKPGKDDDDEDLSSSLGKVAVLLILLVAMAIAAGCTILFFHTGRKSATQAVVDVRRAVRT